MASFESASAATRVRHLLSTADVEPSSVGRSSIFIVRAMPDPAPGELQRDPHGSTASARWVRAARRELDVLRQQAARPAFGPVPASAPAVVFVDPAELLACLARDWLSGDAANRWWWQAWLRASARPTLAIILAAWIREARHAPAAVAALRERGLAARFVEALPVRDVRALFVAITDAFNVPALAAATPAGALPGVERRSIRRLDSRNTRRVAAARIGNRNPSPSSNDETAPPWTGWMPADVAPRALGLERRTLLGISLMLARAPLAVRTESFRRAFHSWRRAEQLVASPIAPGTSQPSAASDRQEPAPIAAAERRVQTRTALDDRSEADRPSVVQPEPAERIAAASDGHVVSGSAVDRTTRRDQRGPKATRIPPPMPPIDSGLRQPASERPAPGDDTTSAGVGTSLARAPSTPAPSPGAGAAQTPPASPIAAAAPPAIDTQATTVGTGFGGVLFLINALVRLDFFDRLDDHFGIDSSIGAWGWLEIVGRSLLGDRHPDADNDPLWTALAALDGRDEGEPLGATFRGPRSYALPDDWPAPDASLAPQQRHYRWPRVQSERALHRFLDAFVPYLRWRLAKAMDIDLSRGDADAVLDARLLRKRARLTTTATHVDLHMGMAQTDIAVRMAGLDANPGWVPALGRVVTFYFDQE